MKMKLVAILLGLILSINVGCVRLQGEVAQPKRAVSGATMEALAPFLGLDVISSIGQYRGAPASLPNGRELRWMVTGNGHVLAVDKKTGRLLIYGLLSRRDSSPLPVVRDKPMTEDEALSLTKAFLTAARIKADLSKATVTHTDFADRQCTWNIVYDHINGKKSLPGFCVCIAAFSNQILFFVLEPTNCPDFPKKKTTPKEAAKAALAVASAGGADYYELTPESPRLILATPLDNKDEKEQKRLYWLVSLVHKRQEENPLIRPFALCHVDCLTGEVTPIR